ncbi:MAG: hypothetical protein HY320_07175 [Armatimonadetes bacterium]|nr:hypothetical protein [Armatimonadota bacterium]
MPHEIAFGVLLASTSGAAIIAHTLALVPLAYAVPFVVLPSVALLLSVMLLRQRQYLGLHLFADRLLIGAIWGLLATLGYDAIRPLLKLAFGFTFDPYRAMPVFGSLMTGLPTTDPLAITVGWIYHFWNGLSFGMMFALVRPRGGPIAGMTWGLGLEGFMLAIYPSLLKARLDDPGFLAMGLVGHVLWGAVLGEGLRKGGCHA